MQFTTMFSPVILVRAGGAREASCLCFYQISSTYSTYDEELSDEMLLLLAKKLIQPYHKEFVLC
jgi:hypothetical protein